MRRFELRIETGGPLSIIELNEIIEIIDDHITQAFDHYDRYFPPYRRRRNLADGVDFSFVGIESARTGSIIVTIAVGGSVVWGLAAIAKGVKRSRLGDELTRLGEHSGNILADGLGTVNARLEDWSKANRQLRERNTKATLTQAPPEEKEPGRG